MDCLADDRDQEECRVLRKFWWQLSMKYQEMTEADPDRHVGPVKREAVQRLIDAIRHSPDAIDAWIAATNQDFPLVQDRGYEAHRSRTAQEHARGQRASNTLYRATFADAPQRGLSVRAFKPAGSHSAFRHG
jgi:hypothetical protein